jgi:hypothetical protein
MAKKKSKKVVEEVVAAPEVEDVKLYEDEEIPTAPAPLTPVDPNMINVAFTQQELTLYANLMSISAQTWEQLANGAQVPQQQDEQSRNVLFARQKLAYLLALKLADSANIGEPTSRDVH